MANTQTNMYTPYNKILLCIIYPIVFNLFPAHFNMILCIAILVALAAIPSYLLYFNTFTFKLIQCDISCTIIFSLSIDLLLFLSLLFLHTVRDIMFVTYYVLLIWQTIISKEKSKNHFRHRLSRWKLPAAAADIAADFCHCYHYFYS